jgi:lipopolysaccharide/colanic/teichoic acid biosynthesis glycosyltransferase
MLSQIANAATKRLFDVTVASAVLAVASPLWLAAAIAIKLESAGPVFHRATRIGRNGKPFTLFKFRSMVSDATEVGPGITRDGDPRITRVGGLLRKLKIDEMPQLINVIRGEMSIVGPRPEDPRYVSLYTLEQLRVLSVRPGMASPAFIKYRHEESLLAALGSGMESVYVSRIMPEKLRMDNDYIDHQSFLHDMAILAEAAASLVRRPRQTQVQTKALSAPDGSGCGSEPS